MGNDIVLSKNFLLSEFTHSDFAVKNGIQNIPSDEHVKNLKTLCEKILQPVRDKFGPLTITSGFRSKALNEAIGGVYNSGHMSGNCADFTPSTKSFKKLDIALWIIKNLEFDQLILEKGDYKDPLWLHVAYNSKPRRQVYRFMNDSGYVAISGDDITKYIS